MSNYIEQPVDFLNAKKEKLFGVLTMPKYITNLPSVIMCHGFAKTKSERKFVELSRFLADKGTASLRFDFSGQGDSEGDFSKVSAKKEVGDLAAAFNFIAKQRRTNSSRVAVIAHSFGVLPAVLFQAQFQKFNTLILLAPALQQKELIGRWYDKEQLALWQNQGYLDTPKGKIDFQYWQEAQAINWQKAISKVAIPILIIHGQKDSDVPLKCSRELLQNLKTENKLEIIEMADHHLESHQAKKETAKLAANWLERFN